MILSLALENDISVFHILSDSLLVVNWLKGENHCSNISLQHFLNRGIDLKYKFTTYTFENKSQVDYLAKVVIMLQEG